MAVVTRYWGLLQKLDQLTEPLAVRSAMGKLPSNEPWLRVLTTGSDVATLHGVWVSGWMDGWRDGWMDGYLYNVTCHYVRR